jgi:hypothetical protein
MLQDWMIWTWFVWICGYIGRELRVDRHHSSTFVRAKGRRIRGFSGDAAVRLPRGRAGVLANFGVEAVATHTLI